MSAPASERSTALNPTPNNPACPVCKRSTYRIHRRGVDLLLNVFVPVLRFRCGAMGCDWEGNLRMGTTPPRDPERH